MAHHTLLNLETKELTYLYALFRKAWSDILSEQALKSRRLFRRLRVIELGKLLGTRIVEFVEVVLHGTGEGLLIFVCPRDKSEAAERVR